MGFSDRYFHSRNTYVRAEQEFYDPRTLLSWILQTVQILIYRSTTHVTGLDWIVLHMTFFADEPLLKNGILATHFECPHGARHFVMFGYDRYVPTRNTDNPESA